MAKRPTNRLKFKLWHADGSIEFDGTIAEGLYYGAWNLSVASREILIKKLMEQQKKAKKAAEEESSSRLT